jgi:hypothetical protein
VSTHIQKKAKENKDAREKPKREKREQELPPDSVSDRQNEARMHDAYH